MSNQITYIQHNDAEMVLGYARAFATSQQAFEQALRAFISENEAVTRADRSDLRDYFTAVAAGSVVTLPSKLTGLDISNLRDLAATAQANRATLEGSIQDHNLGNGQTITDKIADNVAGNPSETNVNDFLNISGDGTQDFERAIEYGSDPDLYPRDAARFFINQAYAYQEQSTEYGRKLQPVIERNNLTRAQAHELNAYMSQLHDGEATPERSAFIQRLADEDRRNFRALSVEARSLNSARDEFTEAVRHQALANRAYQGKANELMSAIDRLSLQLDDESSAQILDTVIDRTMGTGQARSIRMTGWPNDYSASYERGRSVRNTPENLAEWFENLFEGIGGNGNGNGFNWQGLLGGAAGGIGGFFVGRMFGGGIIGTIASAALGIMGAYMGHNFASRQFGAGNEQAGVQGGASANAGATDATDAVVAGPRNIRIPDGQGGHRFVNSQEHQQYLYQLASGSGVRFEDHGVAYNPGGQFTGVPQALGGALPLNAVGL